MGSDEARKTSGPEHDDAGTQASEERIPCPYCAELILPAAIKCPHCGERLDQRRRVTWRVVALVVGVCGLIVGAVAVAALLLQDSEDVDTATSTSTDVTTTSRPDSLTSDLDTIMGVSGAVLAFERAQQTFEAAYVTENASTIATTCREQFDVVRNAPQITANAASPELASAVETRRSQLLEGFRACSAGTTTGLALAQQHFAEADITDQRVGALIQLATGD